MRHLIGLFYILFSSQLFAGELVEYHTSVRALGMGNAYSAVVADKDSLFYNPAGLSRVTGFNVTLADIAGGVDRADMVTTVQDMRSSTSYANTIKQQIGKNLWAGGSGMAAITAPGVGFAAFDKLEAAATLSNPAAPNLDLRFYNDIGFAAGVSVSLLPALHIGVSGMRISRTGADFDIGVATLGSLSSQDLSNRLQSKGAAYSGTVGIVAVLPENMTNPRISGVYKNVGVSMFTQESGTEYLGRLQSELDLGFAFDVPAGPILITTSFDYKYANLAEEQVGKKLHFGTEINLFTLSARGGFSQGYYTVGAGIDLGFLKADAATYGVELGEYPGQKEDRRYVVSINIGFGFDGSAFGSNKGRSAYEKGGRGGFSSGLKPRR